MKNSGGYRVVRWLLSILMLAAAGFKGYQLATEPMIDGVLTQGSSGIFQRHFAEVFENYSAFILPPLNLFVYEEFDNSEISHMCNRITTTLPATRLFLFFNRLAHKRITPNKVEYVSELLIRHHRHN